jgi:Apoptosis antagonizing transcription factor
VPTLPYLWNIPFMRLQALLGVAKRNAGEAAKAAAVRSQQALYERALEARIRLQRCLQVGRTGGTGDWVAANKQARCVHGCRKGAWLDWSCSPWLDWC